MSPYEARLQSHWELDTKLDTGCSSTHWLDTSSLLARCQGSTPRFCPSTSRLDASMQRIIVTGSMPMGASTSSLDVKARRRLDSSMQGSIPRCQVSARVGAHVTHMGLARVGPSGKNYPGPSGVPGGRDPPDPTPAWGGGAAQYKIYLTVINSINYI